MKNRVEELRRMYGVRQEAFAHEMGVSRQSIGSIENGRYNPSTALAIKIARYFGLSVEDVFYLEGARGWLDAEKLKNMPDEVQAKTNYLHNAEIALPEGVITGQGNRFPSQFTYATFNTAHNGAEPVALYNALALTGRQMSFADILLELEGNGLSLLDGFAGTDPRALSRFFDGHNISVHFHEMQADFIADVEEGNAFIISFWNDRFFRELKGLRTVAGVYRDGGWLLYNMHMDDTAPRSYRTLPEGLRGKKFILGYIFK